MKNQEATKLIFLAGLLISILAGVLLPSKGVSYIGEETLEEFRIFSDTFQFILAILGLVLGLIKIKNMKSEILTDNSSISFIVASLVFLITSNKIVYILPFYWRNFEYTKIYNIYSEIIGDTLNYFSTFLSFSVLLVGIKIIYEYIKKG